MHLPMAWDIGGDALGALLLPVIVSTFAFSTGFIFIGITGLLASIIALAGPLTSKQSLEAVST